ncbi:MAG TPA: hypothetical protein VMS12_05125 [Thermoanaerobaculia bacterium]|nr:hypothetical protein [Thermoanaerobaculia bacterium]
MKWFNVALVGWIILVVAVAIAMFTLGVDQIWIIVGALALIGVGVIVSANRNQPPREP